MVIVSTSEFYKRFGKELEERFGFLMPEGGVALVLRADDVSYLENSRGKLIDVIGLTHEIWEAHGEWLRNVLGLPEETNRIKVEMYEESVLAVECRYFPRFEETGGCDGE